jgi:hypothetical protein
LYLQDQKLIDSIRDKEDRRRLAWSNKTRRRLDMSPGKRVLMEKRRQVLRQRETYRLNEASLLHENLTSILNVNQPDAY